MKRTLILSAGASALALMIAMPAMAQEEDSGELRQGTVTVTGSFI